MILLTLFRFAFASTSWLYHLISHVIVTRRPILQKVRDYTHMVLSLLVSLRFQVLFHSPSGVLFTFPSRYYTLSVTRSYLAFGDGSPIFKPDFTCPVLLWNTTVVIYLSPTRLLLCFVVLSNTVRLDKWTNYMQVLNPINKFMVWALSRSLATT